MKLALSTRWNAGRHTDGAALIEEILEMGFERVELGYDLRMDLVPGVRSLIDQGAVTAGTVHNFCPVPVGAPRGHPELFTFAARDPRTRASAVEHTARTIRFAAEIGADTVVSHSGNVDMKRMTRELIHLAESGQMYSPRYEKTMMKLQVKREKKAQKQLPFLLRSLDELMPTLEETGVRLALENLPTWEAFPTEIEMRSILDHFRSPRLGYWHDVGHGGIRQNLGFVNVERWLERLCDSLAGMHVHDVLPPAADHVMPPRGDLDFDRLKPFALKAPHRVIEPSPRTPREDIVQAREFLESCWSDSSPSDEAAQASESRRDPSS